MKTEKPPMGDRKFWALIVMAQVFIYGGLALWLVGDSQGWWTR